MTAPTLDAADAATDRRNRTQNIRRLSAKVRKAEAAYEAAVSDRDQALIASHGDKRDGYLSYDELAQATGKDDTERISKGRVIQIVQGKSDYSIRQRGVPAQADAEG